jgi:uncharacterized protein YbaP (TraB family)
MTRLLRTALALLVAPLLCAGALAQAPADCPPVAPEPTPDQLAAGARDARDHGFLWRISRDGRSSWLYGTLHVAKLAWAFPGPAQRDALARSDTLALELDLLDPTLQARMAQALAAQPKVALPASLQARLDRQAQAECLPRQAIAALAPEMQVAVLATLAGRRDGFDAAYGIDAVLAGYGRAAKLDIVSLETPELQLRTLQMGSPAETVELVEGALAEMESGRARAALRRMATIWADGDLAELQRYESWCDCVKTAADRASLVRLLDERNPKLADSIAQLHAVGQRVFAAVGSLHMIGPTGLPTLMAQRGYRVERIVFPQKPQETRP